MDAWIANHDDKWSFTILYVGLAVVLSIWISLFWLVAVAFVHGLIEWRALALNGQTQNRLKTTLWHLRLDIVLLVFALTLSIYIDPLFALLGLGHGARATAQVSSRVIAWQRTIRVALLTVDDIAQVAKAVKKKPEDTSTELQDDQWRSPSKLDITLFSVAALLVVLIVTAPALTPHSYQNVISILMEELHPWP